MLPASPLPDGAGLPRRSRLRRTLLAGLALAAAGLVAWLLVRAYRDPALMIELAAWRLC